MSATLVADLLEDLSRRIGTAIAPAWPLPIFRAESSLYPRFIRRMLDTFDPVVRRGGNQELARLLRTPSRVAELCYFLLGVSESGLDVPERLRLATHLTSALRQFRPEDPLCRSGLNRLQECACVISADEIGGGSTAGPSDSRALSAALLLLVEFLHVGIPQYGREVHGPYTLRDDTYVMVRSHVDLRMAEIWSATGQLDYDDIHVVELCRGNSDHIRFDLTNHSAALPSSTWSQGSLVYGVVNGSWSEIAHAEALLESILAVMDDLRDETRLYGDDDWLVRHLEARHWCLRSCAQHAGVDWRPTSDDYELGYAQSASPNRDWGTQSNDDRYRYLLAQFGLVAVGG